MSEPKELQVSQQMDTALLCTAAELQYRQNIALRGRASGLTCVSSFNPRLSSTGGLHTSPKQYPSTKHGCPSADGS